MVAMFDSIVRVSVCYSRADLHRLNCATIAIFVLLHLEGGGLVQAYKDNAWPLGERQKSLDGITKRDGLMV